MTNDQRTQPTDSGKGEEIRDDSARSQVSQDIKTTKSTTEPLDATHQSDIYPSNDSPSLERSRLRPPLQPDEIGRLGGYRLLRVLGEGGMGTVYEAEDILLHRTVALKTLCRSLTLNESSKLRFLREARCTAAIEHDNVVPIYQVGEDNGVPFMAMKRLHGESLSQRMESEDRIGWMEAARISHQIASGLAVAHERNLVHRDIKPDNLWIESDTKRVRILDFGLVRFNGQDNALSISGSIMGTPRYMSPEQAQGLDVDARSDIFSLGCVMYHMITGEPPFSGANFTAVLLAVVRSTPPPIDSSLGVPDRLRCLVMRCLEKNPQDRPRTVRELVNELEAMNQVANSGGTAGQRSAVRALNLDDNESKTHSFLSKPPWLLLVSIGLGGFGLVVLCVVVMFLLIFRTYVNEIDSAILSESPKSAPSPYDSLSAMPIINEGIEPSNERNLSAGSPPLAEAPFDAPSAKQHQDRWASYLNVPVEFQDSLGMRFRLIPPGKFMLGTRPEEHEECKLLIGDQQPFWMELLRSEVPQHTTILSKPYYITVHEVTNGVYEEIMSSGAEVRSVRDSSPSLPVEEITWSEAIRFCEIISKVKPELAILSPQDKYSLPTEAQWEFACRGGTLHEFCNGRDEKNDLPKVGWSSFVSDGKSHAVGQLSPNAFGIYDMHGNIAEMCKDVFRVEHFAGLPDSDLYDPIGCTEPRVDRVIRGGSYMQYGMYCRSSAKDRIEFSEKRKGVGFRVVLSVEAARKLTKDL